MPGKLSEEKVAEGLTALKGWKYVQDPPALHKQYRFKDHIGAMGFVTKVALAAEAMNHHPEVRLVYNTVDLTLTTHSAGGVTALDLELAAKADTYR